MSPGKWRRQPVPHWIGLGLAALVAEIARGQATTCGHVRAGRPIAAAAWRPGRIVCVQCVHTLDLPRGSDADMRCDRCGRVCAGVEAGDPVYPGTVQAGGLFYSFGTCSDCCPDPAVSRG